MIRVRLVSEPEYEKMRQDGICREYCVDDFYDLLREKRDFTDGDSSLLLRLLRGVAGLGQGLSLQSGLPAVQMVELFC